jgi:two-component system LytT family response regulator
VLAEVAPDAMPEMEDDGEVAAGRFEKLINIKDRGQIFRVDVDTIERIEAAATTCASIPATIRSSCAKR